MMKNKCDSVNGLLDFIGLKSHPNGWLFLFDSFNYTVTQKQELVWYSKLAHVDTCGLHTNENK
jgi:hypothetical protein